jgi:uncharacterized spore protein YtfJ
MNEEQEKLEAALEEQVDERLQAMEMLFSAASVEAVYSEPVVSGDYTVINAAEVAVAGGFGSGFGYGPNLQKKKVAVGEAKGDQNEAATGGGGGGGGGGGSNARPVAIITIGPEGVSVRPVFDVTKIGLAFFTALGAMLVMFARMWGMSRRLS